MPHRPRLHLPHSPVRFLARLAVLASLLVCVGPRVAWADGARGTRTVAVVVWPAGGPHARVAQGYRTALRAQGFRAAVLEATLDEGTIDPELAELRDAARASELNMDFRAAASKWAALVKAARQSTQIVARPSPLAEALIGLGAAHLEAGEREQAAADFCEARAVRAGAMPSASYAPRVRAAFDVAIAACGARLRALPNGAVLAALAAEQGVDAVVHVAIAGESGTEKRTDAVLWRAAGGRVSLPGMGEAGTTGTGMVGALGPVVQIKGEAASALVARDAPALAGQLGALLHVEPPEAPGVPGWVWWTAAGGTAVLTAVVSGMIAWSVGQDVADVVVTF